MENRKQEKRYMPYNSVITSKDLFVNPWTEPHVIIFWFVCFLPKELIIICPKIYSSPFSPGVVITELYFQSKKGETEKNTVDKSNSLTFILKAVWLWHGRGLVIFVTFMSRMFMIDFYISYHQIILKGWSYFGENIPVKLAWQWLDLQFHWEMVVNLKYVINITTRLKGTQPCQWVCVLWAKC